MAKEASVAPQERVNIVYRPATGNAKEEVELPLKLLMLGDYTLRQDERALEDRKPINIDKDNFEDVMRSQKLNVQFAVDDKLSEKPEEGAQLPVGLKFESMKDFEPEAIANSVPELKKLLELRKALVALKGPLANSAKFRKMINNLIADEESRKKLMDEIGLKEE
jgi:type VI secretion system protein ImpB